MRNTIRVGRASSTLEAFNAWPDRAEVVACLAEFDDLPAIGCEPWAGASPSLAGDLGGAVDCDVVVVVDDGQASQTLGSGERCGPWLMPSMRSPSEAMTQVW